MPLHIASFIGWSNTGKTGFIEGCLLELAKQAQASGAVKCVHHAGSFNLPGKDTTRFYNAGANAAILSDHELALLMRPPRLLDSATLSTLFPQAGVILVEGQIVEESLRVIVGGAASTETELKRPLSEFQVLVSDDPILKQTAISAGLVVIGTSDYPGFVDIFLGGMSMERDVSVTNGGLDLPLNPFVKETFENVILGLLKALKKTDPDAEIVVRIGSKKK